MVKFYGGSEHKEDFFRDSRGASKLEDAAEMYIQAGNLFKMAQKWSGSYNNYVSVFSTHPSCLSVVLPEG